MFYICFLCPLTSRDDTWWACMTYLLKECVMERRSWIFLWGFNEPICNMISDPDVLMIESGGGQLWPQGPMLSEVPPWKGWPCLAGWVDSHSAALRRRSWAPWSSRAFLAKLDCTVCARFYPQLAGAGSGSPSFHPTHEARTSPLDVSW